MWIKLWSKLKESLFSVLPVSILVLIISFTPFANISLYEILVFFICSILLIVGISLFNLGADIALSPMGEYIGIGLTKSKKLILLIVVCFAMGVLTTIAEPDLSVLAEQVKSLMNDFVLIALVGVGVGLLLAIAVLKIVFQKDLNLILMFFYLLVFSLCAILIDNDKGQFLSLSFDSGGVTTGPITVPFIMAMGLGISASLKSKTSKENSFGLISLCSIGPIIVLIVLSIFSNGEMNYTIGDYSVDTSFKYITQILFESTKDVFISIVLVLIFFFILQFTLLKLPLGKIKGIMVGIGFTFIGLVIFLTSVTVGFMPIGYKLGIELANNKIVLVIFAFILGMVVVLAEPAVHVLNKQVEETTTGMITKKQMTIALSIGVGISIGLSVIRIIFGFSILYYLIPGYLISLGLSLFVPKIYTSIAFDSGGVASGPLTSSFILPMAIGACVALRGESEIISLGFGIVAMVAMTPLITIQILGFRGFMAEKGRSKRTIRNIISSDDNQIIYF